MRRVEFGLLFRGLFERGSTVKTKGEERYDGRDTEHKRQVYRRSNSCIDKSKSKSILQQRYVGSNKGVVNHLLRGW